MAKKRLRRFFHKSKAASQQAAAPTALAPASETAASSPTGLFEYLNAAAAARDAGQSGNAEALLIEAATQFPNEAEPAIQHAWIAQFRQDWHEAARRWRAVRERFPENGWGYAAGARALLHADDIEAAEAVLAEGLTRLPDNPGILEGRAECAQRRGDWPEAARRWETLRTRRPEGVSGYLGGARAMIMDGELAEAEALLAKALGQFPDESRIAAAWADCASRRRDWAVAAQRWEAVRRLSPENPAGYASGGAALHALGREDQAEQLLVFAQDRFPESAETAIQYAWVAHHRHDWDEAARRWRAVRARFPDNGWGYAAGGRALLEAGDVDAAQTVLAEGLVRLPDNPGVREAWEKCEQRRISA